MKTSYMNRHTHSGASLIEVLVAILILSFGMLSLGAMLSFSVQLPKLSGYRATAANLASSHIERIRANTVGFANNLYSVPISYVGTFNDDIALVECAYPNCNAASLATMDNTYTQKAVRNELPAGGMLLTCDTDTTTPCSPTSYGNLWIMWREPSTYAALNPTSSDNCPPGINFTPQPRCLYVRFKL
ncbi:type IV pilus modification protein PilV [Polaromonas sp.]|uniref:type IV pilus modification protein PilV n=1 Tax=Polaromonas sp. TaxID=1869339 RepID=UPI0025E5E8CB|nr:type IV pilus modification protein PilV [Polaromonas sp.]